MRSLKTYPNFTTKAVKQISPRRHHRLRHKGITDTLKRRCRIHDKGFLEDSVFIVLVDYFCVAMGLLSHGIIHILMS